MLAFWKYIQSQNFDFRFEIQTTNQIIDRVNRPFLVQSRGKISQSRVYR